MSFQWPELLWLLVALPLLAHFLIDGHEHHAVVVDALQPEKHGHHAYIEHQHEYRREPIQTTAAQAGVVVERRGYI